MLTIYRRHKSTCKCKDDRISKRCRCALWVKGTLEGQPYQRSLKTRSFERAEQLKKDIESGRAKQDETGVSTEHALDTFLKECESRNLNASTQRKYKGLVGSMRSFAQRRQAALISDWTVELCREFRASWALAPRTASKQLERLRAFFTFCADNDWIPKNPSKKIKPPQIRPNPTLPFTDTELTKLFANLDTRSQVFFRVLRHSGLRIIDAAQLRPEKIIGGRLFLHTEKTGVPIFIPLPPELLTDLRELPLVGGSYFATESDNPISIAEYFRQKLMKAAIKGGLMTKRKKGEPPRKNPVHPHRFRDTFACDLLMKGVPLEMVSKLLGHSSVKITEEHYAPWIKGRQDQLEEAVMRTWENKPRLLRSNEKGGVTPSLRSA